MTLDPSKVVFALSMDAPTGCSSFEAIVEHYEEVFRLPLIALLTEIVDFTGYFNTQLG